MLCCYTISLILLLLTFSFSTEATKNGKAASSTSLTKDSSLHKDDHHLEDANEPPNNLYKIKQEIGRKSTTINQREKSASPSHQAVQLALNFHTALLQNDQLHSMTLEQYHTQTPRTRTQQKFLQNSDLHHISDHPENAAGVERYLLAAKERKRIDEEQYHVLLHNHRERAKAVQHVLDKGVVQGMSGSLHFLPEVHPDHAHVIAKHDITAKLKGVKDGKKYLKLKFEPAEKGWQDMNKEIIANAAKVVGAPSAHSDQPPQISPTYGSSDSIELPHLSLQASGTKMKNPLVEYHSRIGDIDQQLDFHPHRDHVENVARSEEVLLKAKDNHKDKGKGVIPVESGGVSSIVDKGSKHTTQRLETAPEESHKGKESSHHKAVTTSASTGSHRHADMHIDIDEVLGTDHAMHQSDSRTFPHSPSHPEQPLTALTGTDKMMLPYDVTKAKLKQGKLLLQQESLKDYRQKRDKELSSTHSSRLYNLHPIEDHPINASQYRIRLMQRKQKGEISQAEYDAHASNAVEKLKATLHIDGGGILHSLDDELIHLPNMNQQDVHNLHQKGQTARLTLLKQKQGENIRRLKFTAPPDKKRKRLTKDFSQSNVVTRQEASQGPKSILTSGLSSKDDVFVPHGLPPSYSSKVTRYLRDKDELKVASAFHHRKEVEETLPKDHLEHKLGIDPVQDHRNNLAFKKMKLDKDRMMGKLDSVEYQIELHNAEMKAKLLDEVDKGGFARAPFGKYHHHSALDPTIVHQQLNAPYMIHNRGLVIGIVEHNGNHLHRLKWKDGTGSSLSLPVQGESTPSLPSSVEDSRNTASRDRRLKKSVRFAP